MICSRFWSDVKPENRLSREGEIWPYLPNHLTKIIQNFKIGYPSSSQRLSCWTIFQISILRWSKIFVWTDRSELTDLQKITINLKTLRWETSKILIFLQQLGILRSYISPYRPNSFWGNLHILKIQGTQNSRFYRLPRLSLRIGSHPFLLRFLCTFLWWWIRDECRS